MEYGLFKLGYTSLKAEQMRAVESVLKGKDTFVSTPTGFGKSLIFQVHPAAYISGWEVQVLCRTGCKHYSLTPSSHACELFYASIWKDSLHWRASPVLLYTTGVTSLCQSKLSDFVACGCPVFLRVSLAQAGFPALWSSVCIMYSHALCV